MIAFDSPIDALNLCIAAQEQVCMYVCMSESMYYIVCTHTHTHTHTHQLLHVEWPEHLLANEDAAVEHDTEGKLLWRYKRERER